MLFRFCLFLVLMYSMQLSSAEPSPRSETALLNASVTVDLRHVFLDKAVEKVVASVSNSRNIRVRVASAIAEDDNLAVAQYSIQDKPLALALNGLTLKRGLRWRLFRGIIVVDRPLNMAVAKRLREETDTVLAAGDVQAWARILDRIAASGDLDAVAISLEGLAARDGRLRRLTRSWLSWSSCCIRSDFAWGGDLTPLADNPEVARRLNAISRISTVKEEQEFIRGLLKRLRPALKIASESTTPTASPPPEAAPSRSAGTATGEELKAPLVVAKHPALRSLESLVKAKAPPVRQVQALMAVMRVPGPQAITAAEETLAKYHPGDPFWSHLVTSIAAGYQPVPVNTALLVPVLKQSLSSNDVNLRRSALTVLRRWLGFPLNTKRGLSHLDSMVQMAQLLTESMVNEADPARRREALPSFPGCLKSTGSFRLPGGSAVAALILEKSQLRFLRQDPHPWVRSSMAQELLKGNNLIANARETIQNQLNVEPDIRAKEAMKHILAGRKVELNTWHSLTPAEKEVF